ncbi:MULTISPECIES: helix-turn-helix domain-containing protein [Mesorhizobium]|uniref:Helix-turn-helix domain-containing protein n=1 Tax=Mesorhizobium denitrificans TaxID=2294114 RepID=A0A371XI92_9HYPH|nr:MULTISPECIES: helix-turn-helix domain-containing protein [Mesorhizobium]RFC68941.1 helix-turn-helix domain-containing protein [Mesorhizobium denitrificans]
MEYSTLAAEAGKRGAYWTEAVCSAYFPLTMQFKAEDTFNGRLKNWELGITSLSHLESDAVHYSRRQNHLVEEMENSLLITIPEWNEVSFLQSNRDARCVPGHFLIERGDAPYEFSYGSANSLWVLKVPNSALRARVGSPDRFAALCFNAQQGVGAYFADKIRATGRRLDEMTPPVREVVGQQLIDLLCLTIQDDPRIMASGMTSVRAAHLFRAEQFIRQNLAKGSMQPQEVADACGISLRYLQRLFTDSGRSIYEWIREQRLLMCDEELRRNRSPQSIAEIAYRWGFSDHSQFSKNYRHYFGRSPTQARSDYRERLRS